MSNASVHAFFIGRVLAESISNAVEKTLTNALSEVGKFDAEQREALRKFAADVLERAATAEAGAVSYTGSDSAATGGSDDLQEMIDNLRAETAQLRAELQKYRNQ
jgi:siroheme synthase (precorrin-2 oxidase/ferrochelatase)